MNFSRALLCPLLTIFLAGTSLPAIAAWKVDSLKFSPDPPEPGTESIVLVLKDAKGEPLTKAAVSLRVGMVAMGSMPEMHMDTDLKETRAGTYEGEVDLSMGGTWEVTTRVKQGDQEETFHASITTGVSGVTDRGSQKASSASVSATTELPVSAARLQTTGVRFEEARQKPLIKQVRSAGVVETDTSRRAEVSLRYSGFVATIKRGRVGESVASGDTLFTIDSPEAMTIQSDALLGAGEGGASLGDAARSRLRALNFAPGDIDRLLRAKKPLRELQVLAPQAGSILEVNISPGAKVEPGQVVYVIGDLRKSYCMARVFQQDARDLAVGQHATIIAPGSPKGRLDGRVDLILPQSSSGAGTVDVRVEITDTDSGLRLGSFVEILFDVDLGTHLAIPAESILYSGATEYVFVERGSGRLEPRKIITGRSAGDDIEIVEGLQAGERVAASGNFLLDSEAKLRSALPKWKNPDTQPVTKESTK